tara:strand:+ start:1080 stop:1967 length:888 start_codon:yes stop_codon:yes gene_type:complete
MDLTVPLPFQIAIYAFIALSILTSVLKIRVTTPYVSILNRWFRWFGISFGGAFLVFEAGWFYRPYWSLAVVGFLLWFLIETVYNWLAVSALSQSSFALFPSFVENTSGEEWPASKRSLKLRDWLRQNKFKKIQALTSDLGNGLLLRSSVYEDVNRKIRIQILFIPQSGGAMGYSFSFTSETEDGVKFVTDNLYVPYGGFYPENWNISRNPWVSDIHKLFCKHKDRIQNKDIILWEESPLLDLNEQQKLLERINVKEGFLLPYHLQEEQGRISYDGRYRVWKEIWFINYLGIFPKH